MAPVLCNTCHKAIPVDASGRIPAFCPRCGAMVILDDTEAQVTEMAPAPAEAELEERRIRQIVRSRRAVVRTRGWYLVALLASVILALQQLTGFVMAIAQRQRDVRQIVRVVLAMLLLAAAGWLWGCVKRITAELERSSLPEPTAPPDFTSLSDGSQQVRNLEELDQ